MKNKNSKKDLNLLKIRAFDKIRLMDKYKIYLRQLENEVREISTQINKIENDLSRTAN